MKKHLYYLILGTLFGIILLKSEVVSWFRINEMFQFESFHMFGIIGSAVVCLAIAIAMIKKVGAKTVKGKPIKVKAKSGGWKPLIIGGTLFGLGWAITGACPGPMFVLLGKGVYSIGVVILFAMFGTFVFGLLKPHLPK
tara:strand:- start:39034 stop:39450 length:417 start_codon:yes stop_codon:yes gene_type:complete